MINIILDAELRRKLHDLAGLMEIRDEQGRVVGYVAPVSGNGSLYADLEVPVTDEEVQRLLQQPRGRPLADILADLDKRS